MRACCLLAAALTCAESWRPHARTPHTYLAAVPRVGLRGSQISFLHTAATADEAKEPSTEAHSAAVWRHAPPPAEREFGIPQLLGYLWPMGGARLFGLCKAKLMVSLSLGLLFAAKLFVVKARFQVQPPPATF